MSLKRFSTKSVVCVVIIVAILLMGGFIWVMLNGNPISKNIAKNQYKKYLEETYGKNDFKVNEMFYDFMSGSYVANVISESKNIEFKLNRRHDNVIEDGYRDVPTLLDDENAVRFRDEIAKEVMEGVKSLKNGEFINHALVEITLLQGKYNKDTKFTKDIDAEFKISFDFKNNVLKDEDGSLLINTEFIDLTYAVKELIKNKEYKGLNELSFGFTDGNNHQEFIMLDKNTFNTPKEKLLDLKVDYESRYGKSDLELKLTENISEELKNIKNLEDVSVYRNSNTSDRDNLEVFIKILKETKPTREELGKETYIIKELIRSQFPEIKYMDINFYEHGEIHPKGGRQGEYYGSMFIGNEFAPWSINEEEVNWKLKISEKL